MNVPALHPVEPEKEALQRPISTVVQGCHSAVVMETPFLRRNRIICSLTSGLKCRYRPGDYGARKGQGLKGNLDSKTMGVPGTECQFVRVTRHIQTKPAQYDRKWPFLRRSVSAKRGEYYAVCVICVGAVNKNVYDQWILSVSVLR